MLQTMDSCRHSECLESLFALCLPGIKDNIKVTCKPVSNAGVISKLFGFKIVSQTDLPFYCLSLNCVAVQEKLPGPASCEEGWLLLFMDGLREEGKRELEKGLERS